MLAASCSGDIMLTLYSYPELFGVADKNGYGLKVFAFLKLAGVPFTHQHVFDASAAPRGQLPYIVDDGDVIGDSEAIVAHCIGKYRLSIDAGIYGFIANIHFYDIDTPLKQFVSSHANLVRHCDAIHAAVTAPPQLAR